MLANKLTQEEWREIEIECNEFELRVIKIMLDSSSLYPISSQDQLKIEVLGESLYQELLHEKVLKHFFSEEAEKLKENKKEEKQKKEKGKGKAKKGGQKKGKNDIYEKFIKNEKKKKIEELFLDTLKASPESLFRQKNFGFSSCILEIKFISFLVLYKLLKDKEEWVYEIIIGLKKCLISYENYKGKLHYDEKNLGASEAVAETLIGLVKSFLDSIIEMNVFSMRITFIRYPKLIYHTIFDKYFQNIQLKPYASQKEILKILRNYCKKKENRLNNPQGMLVFYKAMIGSGKTTVCVALSSMVNNLRIEYPMEYENLQVIFCCGLTQIRIQVGQLLFNALNYEKISFAIASSEEKAVILRRHFSCKTEKHPVLIITDLETTELLLKKKKGRYILFLDEPIIDADQKECPFTEMFLKIMRNSPDFTILSSSTLPNPEEVPNLVKMFRGKFNDAEITTIISDQAKISQQIYINFNEKYYPHNGCETREELAVILKAVKTSPFLSKLYTGPSLYHFEEKIKSMGLSKFLGQSVEERFNDPVNMSQKYVQNTVFELLEAILHNCEDFQIKEFCMPTFEEIIEKSSFKWEHLATKSANLFLGGCLIATPTALDFARKTFGNFVEKVNLKTLLKDYAREKELFENKLNEFEDIKNEEVKLKQKTQYINENTPRIDFPRYMKINLKEHLIKYSDIKKPELVGYRKDFLLEDLIFKIDEDINLMLFSGIGIFENDKILNEEYNQTIRNKAKFGELAYLISHKDILYGANYPLNNVIIKDSFAENFSINTIFQTMGRAGRIGQAWKSNCYIAKKTQERISTFIRNIVGGKSFNIEAKNIESLCEVEKENEDIIVDKKIHIIYDENSIESVVSVAICLIYYLQKLQKQTKKRFSDLDFLEYFVISPVDSLQKIDFHGQIYKKTIIFNSLPLKNLSINSEKVIFCGDVAQSAEINNISNIKTFNNIAICEKKGLSNSCFEFYNQKFVKKGLSANIILPNYVKKTYNENLEWKHFEQIAKAVKNEAIYTEKIFKYCEIYGFSLKSLHKIMTCSSKINKSSFFYEIFAKKCEGLVKDYLKIVEFSSIKYLVLSEIPLKYEKFKEILKDLVIKKADELKMPKVCVFIWSSFKNKEEILIYSLGLEGSICVFGGAFSRVTKEMYRKLQISDVGN